MELFVHGFSIFSFVLHILDFSVTEENSGSKFVFNVYLILVSGLKTVQILV